MKNILDTSWIDVITMTILSQRLIKDFNLTAVVNSVTSRDVSRVWNKYIFWNSKSKWGSEDEEPPGELLLTTIIV